MKLLLAEDERELSRATTVILEHQGNEVDAAYDGEEALEFIQNNSYDAIVLDIMMPKKDGIEVLKAARQHGVLSPIIMLTAKAETDDKILGLDSGANDYLTKPFAVKELLARIRAVTRTSLQMIPDKIQFGGTVLSRESLELSGIKSSVRLSSYEFRLMEVLMENPEKQLSTEQLFERIWGKEKSRGYEADSETVWMYILYLRNKLSSISSDIQISGEKSKSYSLEDKNRGL